MMIVTSNNYKTLYYIIYITDFFGIYLATLDQI